MLLLTAFGPFGGDSVNPAQLVAERIRLPGVRALILPVEYGTASRIALQAIDELQPSAVIDLGQAGGRTGITPEKYAVNLRNALSPDNAGRICTMEPIVPGAAERLESTFGAEAIAEALLCAGIPAYVSEGAGTYVCNDVMYSVLHHLSGTGIRAGFIHVPFSRRQQATHPGAFTMEEDEMVRGIETAIRLISGEKL